jgi:hypothetical protein
MKILVNRNLFCSKQKANNKVGFNMSQHIIHMLSQNISPLYLKPLFSVVTFCGYKCVLEMLLTKLRHLLPSELK